MGTITFHPWPVRRDDVDHPDELRLDLDPQPGTDFPDAVRVAAEARGSWTSLGTPASEDLGRPRYSYLRPHRATLDVTEIRHAAIAFGRELERRLPGQVTTKWWKEERGERVFVDYNQNARDRTIASACARPRPGAPVSAPVTWDELPRWRPRTSRSRRCPRAFAEVLIATRRSTRPSTYRSRCWTCTRTTPPRDGGTCLPARLPEDAGRASAALARSRPPARWLPNRNSSEIHLQLAVELRVS